MPEPTPIQKQLEQLYRGQSAKRPPTKIQQSLNNAYKDLSVSDAQRARSGSTVSARIRWQSNIRQYKASAKANFARFGKEAKTAITRLKTRSAVNISKFNGGVKARYGAAIGGLKAAAIKRGIVAPTLASLTAKGGFLYGVNTIPGLALVAGNIAVWKRNTNTLKNIYGAEPGFAVWMPLAQQKILEATPPPFTGGQSVGVMYRVVTFNNTQGDQYRSHDVLGAVTGIYYVDSGQTTSDGITSTRWVARLGNGSSTHPSVSYIFRIPSTVQPPGGFDVRITSITRVDGQPDTGGNPPGGTEPVYSQGGVSTQTIVNNVTNNYTTINKVYPPPPSPTNNVNTSSQISDAQAERGERIPQQVVPSAPLPTPIPTPSPTQQPQSPTDAPPETTENPIPNDTDKKPKTTGGKTQTFPATREETNVDFEQIEKERQKHQITNVKFDPISSEPTDEGWFSKRRNITLEKAAEKAGLGDKRHLPSSKITMGKTVQKVSTNPSTVEPKTEEEPKFTPLIVGKAATVTTTVNQPVPEPKNQAPISQCSKGCSGVTPVNTSSPGSTGADASNLNDLLLQNPLLVRIDQTTTTTMDAVTHADHGLERIQKFAQTAWSVTRADKIMNGVAMVMTVHNAMMLSNNLLMTISEATDMALNALNIRDETDAPIDFGNAIKQKINAVMSSILGEAAYTALTQRIAKANRIYQSSINLLDSVHSLMDSARSVAETTAENTGKIGNALRDAGAVYEDAYEKMVEEINPQNRAMRNLDGLRGKIEGTVEAVETVTQISSEVVEFQDNLDYINDEWGTWKTEVDTWKTEKTEEREIEKTEAQIKTDIVDTNFDAAPPENTEGS